MLTPAFDLCQDADFLTIVIKVPYAKVSEFDVYYEGEDFKFYAKPYFLRLTLPGRIVEDGREKASYNIDEGAFTIKLPKETPGQHFEGLGMLTALLAQKGSRSAKPLVEELDAPTEPEEDDDDFDWQIEQTPFEENDAALNSQCSYGFGNLRSGVFGRLQDELSDVIDVKNPDVTPAEERQEARMAAEDAKFDPDHYLADLFEDDAIQHMLKYKSWWADACPRRTSPDGRSTPEQDSQETLVSFTDDEKRKLRNFKNKSFLLDKRARHQALLSLIDIILAYCYEVRVTEGEHNVESSWNIRKLSGTLAWLQSYSSVHDVMVSFGRRVLCYSLHRHFKLVESSVKDAIKLLQMGKAAVLKCLLDIHCIFQENDPAYILNDLYITDYCIWIQKVKSKRLTALAECLQTTTLTKADLGFELEEVELAARLVQEEEKQAVASSTVSRQLLLSSEVEASDSDESSSASSSETEDSDTEETDSDDEELSDSEDVKITCSQDGLQEKGKGKALLLEGNRLIQDSDAAVAQDTDVGKSDSSLQSRPVSAHLVEELGEKLRTAVVLSEQSEELELVTEMDRDLQEASTSYAHGPSKHLVEELGEKLRTAVVLSEQSEELELVTEMDRDLQEASTSCAHGPSKHVEDCNKCGHFLDVSHKKNPLLIVSDYKDEDDKANLLESV